MTAAAETIGFAVCRNKDWFNSNLPGIQDLLTRKQRAHAVHLRNPVSLRLREEWRGARAETQRVLCKMENSWWLRLADEIQGFADSPPLGPVHPTESSTSNHLTLPRKKPHSLASTAQPSLNSDPATVPHSAHTDTELEYLTQTNALHADSDHTTPITSSRVLPTPPHSV